MLRTIEIELVPTGGQAQMLAGSLIRRPLDKPIFGVILLLLIRLFSPANVKEATAMHLSDGPLAPLPGAEQLCRIFPPKSIPQKRYGRNIFRRLHS